MNNEFYHVQTKEESETWGRDLAKVIEELNRLYKENLELKQKLDNWERWAQREAWLKSLTDYHNT